MVQAASLSRMTGRLVLVVCVSFLVTADTRADTLPDDLRQLLESNAAALDPITLEWEKRFTFADPLPERYSKKALPNGIAVLDCGQMYQYQGGCVRALTRFCQVTPGDASSEPPLDHVSDLSFDGRAIFVGSGEAKFRRGGVGTLMIGPLGKFPKSHSFDWADFPYFAGFYFPVRFGELGQPQESLILYLLKHGGKVQEIRHRQGAEASVIEIEIIAPHPIYSDPPESWTMQFVVDEHFGLAVREMVEITPARKVARKVQNSAFRKLEATNVWLPGAIQVQDFFVPDKSSPAPGRLYDSAVSTIHMSLTKKSERKLNASDFAITYAEPGTMISDSRPAAQSLPRGKLVYTVPANQADLDEVVRLAKERAESREPSSRVRWVLLLVGNVCACVVIACAVLWWRRRQA